MHSGDTGNRPFANGLHLPSHKTFSAAARRVGCDRVPNRGHLMSVSGSS